MLPTAPTRAILAPLQLRVLEVEPELELELLRLQRELDRLDLAWHRQQELLERHRMLLDRTVGLLRAQGEGLVASEALDVMIAATGAERGFVGLALPGGGWKLLVARAISQTDIDSPAGEVATTVIGEALGTGRTVLADDALEAWADRGSVQRLGLRSVACLPILHGGRRLGFVYLDHRQARARFDREGLDALESWMRLVGQQLQQATEQAEEDPFPGFVTRSPGLLAELRELARLARYDLPVLITGATGTGKSRLATALHQRSRRARGPMVHLNCSAVPEGLIEGELFGSEAGAFTGAQRRRIGKFEAAAGGTLFLDEIDTMPISGQVKLLVALQERVITRLGSNEPIKLDVRVVAATNADPQKAIAAGRLREDLYFRLAGAKVHLPPLSDRPEDIPLLTQHILQATIARHGLPPLRLSRRAQERIAAHPWPGNVRELEHVLDRAALLAGEDGVIDELRMSAVEEAEPRRLTVGRSEFLAAWAVHQGAISDVAVALGVTRRTIFRLKHKYLDAAG